VLNAETNVLVPVGFGKPEDYVGKDVKGKFVLASRGEIYFADKLKNAAAAGVAGLIVYNNAPGLISGALSADGSVSPVAVFMIEQEVGKNILAKIAAGQEVKATVHTLITDYMAFQGTSMATPHVSGVVALMKAANHNLTPSQVKSILVKTATPLGPNDKINMVQVWLMLKKQLMLLCRFNKLHIDRFVLDLYLKFRCSLCSRN